MTRNPKKNVPACPKGSGTSRRPVPACPKGSGTTRQLVFLAAAVPVLAFASSALADDTIKHPGDHPDYGVEIEPHGLVGWLGGPGYNDNGYGVGVRFGIPIVKNGFIRTINNSVAITFGADVLFYSGCWYAGGNCSATYLDFPVAMQWNFFVAQRWSVFGEVGAYVFHGFFSDCPFATGCPTQPTETGIYPALYLGGRYHFSDKVSLTMRLGFPTASIGASFFL